MKAWPDYATMQNEDPNSDGAAITRLLAKSNLKFPSRAARVRMFHLPTPDHRTELMIIYGEALPEDSTVPLRKEGSDVTQESPALAQKLLEDLKSQLAIHPKWSSARARRREGPLPKVEQPHAGVMRYLTQLVGIQTGVTLRRPLLLWRWSEQALGRPLPCCVTS